MSFVTSIFLGILSGVQLLTRNANLSTSYKVDGIDLVKELFTIYRPGYIFRKSYVIKLIKSLTKFIYSLLQCIPNVSLKFRPCQKICK